MTGPTLAPPEALYDATLRTACAHLAVPPEALERILATQALSLGGIDFALRLNPDTRHLEFFGDCGLPAAGQEGDLYRQLLEDALDNDLPALAYALHPLSRHVVLRGSLPLCHRAEGELCAALLLAAAARVQQLRQRFSWDATQASDRFPVGTDAQPGAGVTP